MKRAKYYAMVLVVAFVFASLSVCPVIAHDAVVPQTIDDANELAEFQMHLLDQQTVEVMVQGSGIANHNDLAAYQAELAGNVGVAPAYQWNHWYAQYNQLCDCQVLADYMNHLVDINMLPNAL